MPRWNDGLVDAFPVPLDHQLSKLSLKGKSLRGENAAEDELNEGLVIPYNPNPFRFFSLPAELRNRIYNLVLFSKPPYRLASGKRRGSRIAILLVSKRLHEEASYALYSTTKFLIFPVQEFNALPTIDELPLKYRLVVANLAMTVGSSWTDPPRSWRVSKHLKRCLTNLKNVQTVSVFVEFDPSHPAFRRFRISETFYTDFCGELLEDVLDAMPQVQYVQLDGNSGVDVHGPLVTRLREEAIEQEKYVRWGPHASWAHAAKHDPSPTSSQTLKITVGSRSKTGKQGYHRAQGSATLQNRVLDRVRDT